MSTAWRIVKSRHVETAFDGEAARRYGGRWNSPGTAVVYASETLALATLEVLVHLQASRLLGFYSAFEVTFDEALVRSVHMSDLPDNWRLSPASTELQRIGDEWTENEDSPVLRVPSAVISLAGHNYLLNPNHPDFPRITVGPPNRVEFDPRLLRK